MTNSDKNMNAMNITLTIAKVTFVTAAAFINPWLVIPAFIIAELVSTTFQNKPKAVQPKANEILTPNTVSEETVQPISQELVIEKVEEAQAKEEPVKKRKKRTPKSSDNSSNQQAKSSKPRGRRGNQN